MTVQLDTMSTQSFLKALQSPEPRATGRPAPRNVISLTRRRNAELLRRHGVGSRDVDGMLQRVDVMMGDRS